MEAIQQRSNKVYSWGIGMQGQLGIDIEKKCSGKSKCCMLPEKVKLPKGKNPVQITNFTKCSMVLTDSGEVYAFGTNSKGRLGIKGEETRIPTPVPNLINIVKIDTGYFHSLAVDSQGQAWSSGQGQYGELGRQSVGDNSFSAVEQTLPFKEAIAGFGFSFFITQDDMLYSCGKKSFSGQSKDGKDGVFAPKILPFFKETPIKQIECGMVYVCAITRDSGEAYSWGSNTFKQLGYEIKASKKVDADFVQKPHKILFEGDLKIKQISCARSEKHVHTGCLTEDGDVYMWGDPYKGQQGLYEDGKGWTHEEKNMYVKPQKMNLNFLQPTDDKVSKVLCGGIHSALLTEQGKLYTFGCGSDGRLGHPEYEGHVYLYKESKPKLVEAFNGKNVIDVQSSYNHMLAIVQ